MKTIWKLSMLFGVLAITACQNNNDMNTDYPDHAVDVVKIIDGMIQSPGWLADEVERLADQYNRSPYTGEKLYPLVYYVRHNERDYIYISDGLNACYVCGTLYFTLSGEPVDANNNPLSGLYGALENARRESDIGIGNNHLLWKYEYKSTKRGSIFTRADSEIEFYTPNGTLVPDTWIRDEIYTTHWDIVAGQNYYKASFPHAEEVSGPSTTYNCHGYAWSMAANGPPVWIGYDTPGATHLFVDDDSYIRTPPDTHGAIVRYIGGDHSAIWETNNIVVSKWNQYPVYRHNIYDHPFIMGGHALYELAPNIPITGQPSAPSNTDVTFSLPPSIPSRFAFTDWEITPGTYTTTGGLNNRTLTARFTAAGSYTIKANFSIYAGETYTVTKPINVVTPPNIVITGNRNPSLRVNHTYSVPTSLPTGVTFTGWTISDPLDRGYTVTGGTTGRSLNIWFNGFGQYTLTANFILPGNVPYPVPYTISVPQSLLPPMIFSFGSIVFVEGVIYGADYEWQGNGQYLGIGPELTLPSHFSSYVQCRVYYEGLYSDWSSEIYVYVPPAPAPQEDEEEEDAEDEPAGLQEL